MRAFLLLLLAGCGTPLKYQVFDVAPGHSDVIWVLRRGDLYRCANTAAGPVCAEARYQVVEGQRRETSAPAKPNVFTEPDWSQPPAQ